MKTRRFVAVAVLAAAVLLVLACNALTTTAPTVSNIRMATDETGKTPTSTYAPGDTFYVLADLNGLSKGSTVEAKWYAVDAQGVGPNTLINTSDYQYQPGIGYLHFDLSTSDGGNWPVGTYKVELYLDGEKVGEQGFTVQ